MRILELLITIVSEFMLIDPQDPRIQTTWGNSKECFSNAAKLFPFLVESIEIPYEQGATLPGYFYHNSKENVQIGRAHV